MPELPDVETFKRYLDATALHQKIQKVHVRPSAVGSHIIAPAARAWRRDPEIAAPLSSDEFRLGRRKREHIDVHVAARNVG